MNNNVVLCGANAYKRKYYLDEKFSKLPEQIKRELQIMCVTFTEEVGGVLILEFDHEGELILRTEANEDDILYDEISSGLKVRKLRYEKQELFESLEMYYRIMFMGMDN